MSEPGVEIDRRVGPGWRVGVLTAVVAVLVGVGAVAVAGRGASDRLPTLAAGAPAAESAGGSTASPTDRVDGALPDLPDRAATYRLGAASDEQIATLKRALEVKTVPSWDRFTVEPAAGGRWAYQVGVDDGPPAADGRSEPLPALPSTTALGGVDSPCPPCAAGGICFPCQAPAGPAPVAPAPDDAAVANAERVARRVSTATGAEVASATVDRQPGRSVVTLHLALGGVAVEGWDLVVVVAGDAIVAGHGWLGRPESTGDAALVGLGAVVRPEASPSGDRASLTPPAVVADGGLGHDGAPPYAAPAFPCPTVVPGSPSPAGCTPRGRFQPDAVRNDGPPAGVDAIGARLGLVLVEGDPQVGLVPAYVLTRRDGGEVTVPAVGPQTPAATAHSGATATTVADQAPPSTVVCVRAPCP